MQTGHRVWWILFLIFTCVGWGAAADQVDLNRASAAQLEAIKGIGPKKAEAIIKYREEHGGFRSVDELDNVPGFGKKTVEKLRDHLTITGARPPPLREKTKMKVKMKEMNF